jgi:hypothetical protein
LGGHGAIVARATGEGDMGNYKLMRQIKGEFAEHIANK